MTRPSNSVLIPFAKSCQLVLEGSEVKVRLLAERLNSRSHVHVDWVRFSCQLRNAPIPGVETLFPMPCADDGIEPLSGAERDLPGMRLMRLRKLLGKLPDAEFSASAQAMELGERICEVLGDDFVMAAELRKGHDFYRHRFSIEREGKEVGWVGFLASGESPRARAQSTMLHANIYGSACTFARSGWRDHMANLIDDVGGTITRVDLALDFFDGLRGGLDRVKDDHESGLCDHLGKRPVCNMVGDWTKGGVGRSFYLGSRAAGKQTNVYEKGVQLFGEKDASKWVRAELRWGNKFRKLESDMLRRPSDFFAAGSDWHAALLVESEADFVPGHVPCDQRARVETIEAEVTRNVRWQIDVAASSFALSFQYLGMDGFLELVSNRKLPGRLQQFKEAEIAAAYAKVFSRVTKGAGAGHAMA